MFTRIACLHRKGITYAVVPKVVMHTDMYTWVKSFHTKALDTFKCSKGGSLFYYVRGEGIN